MRILRRCLRSGFRRILLRSVNDLRFKETTYVFCLRRVYFFDFNIYIKPHESPHKQHLTIVFRRSCHRIKPTQQLVIKGFIQDSLRLLRMLSAKLAVRIARVPIRRSCQGCHDDARHAEQQKQPDYSHENADSPCCTFQYSFHASHYRARAISAQYLYAVLRKCNTRRTYKGAGSEEPAPCAKRTRLELATSAVTGLRSNQTELPLHPSRVAAGTPRIIHILSRFGKPFFHLFCIIFITH